MSLFERVLSEFSLENLLSVAAVRCANRDGKMVCNLCETRCPEKAIRLVDGVSVDRDRCILCGICAGVCPHAVFEAALFADAALLGRAGDAASAGTVPRFECTRCGGRYGEVRRPQRKGRETIELPCLGRLDEVLMLEAMAATGGVVEFGLCDEKCHCAGGRRAYREAAALADGFRILDFGLRIGMAGTRLNAKRQRLKDSKGGPDARRSLLLSAGHAAIRETFPLDIIPARPSADAPDAGPLEKRVRLLTLLKSKIQNPKSQIRRHGSDRFPFARMRIGNGCTLCEVCTERCPTGALLFTRVKGEGVILFHAGRCTGCGLCAALCPEGVVDLGREISAGELLSRAEVAHRGRVLVCSECKTTYSLNLPGAEERYCPRCVRVVKEWGAA